MSSMFLLVSKCWYEVPEAQIAGSRGTTFWRIFPQPFQLSEDQPRPCRAFCYDYSLQPNSRHTFNLVTSITLSKTVSHGIAAPKICISSNVEGPPVPYISVALKWKQWGHWLAKLLPGMHAIPDQDTSFSETRLANWGTETPTSGTEFNTGCIDKEHDPAQLGPCSLHLRSSTCVLNLVTKKNKQNWQRLYNKVSLYVLCKANEIFMVGVNVRDLDINQQQHLLE